MVKPKSIKTTMAGLIAAVAVIADVLVYVFADAATYQQAHEVLMSVGVAVGAGGLLAARDNDVSSEEAGAK